MKPAAGKVAGKPATRKSKNDSQSVPGPKMPAQLSQGTSLYDAVGARKYLTAGERDAFLHAAEEGDREIRSLCMTLAYAGCPKPWRSPWIGWTWRPERSSSRR